MSLYFCGSPLLSRISNGTLAESVSLSPGGWLYRQAITLLNNRVGLLEGNKVDMLEIQCGLVIEDIFV